MGLHYFKLIHEILYGLGFQDSFLEKYTAVQSIILMIHHDVKLKNVKELNFMEKMVNWLKITICLDQKSKIRIIPHKLTL